MARARRLTCIPRLRIPETPRDLALNRAEVLRVVATGSLDFATARMMLWALQLSATGLRSEDSRLRQARIRPANPNRIYQVPVSGLFPRIYAENPLEVFENNEPEGEGYTNRTPATTSFGLTLLKDASQPPEGRQRLAQDFSPGKG